MNHQVRYCFPNRARLNHPFWTFSLSVYAREPVARGLLQEQEQRDIWINDWLFALWSGRQGNTLAPDFRQILTDWQAWRDAVIRPWRARRMAAGRVNNGAYRAMKSAELALERSDQAWLFHHRHALWSGTVLAPPAALHANLTQLDGGIGPSWSESLCAAALAVSSSGSSAGSATAE